MGCYQTKDTAEFNLPSKEQVRVQNNNNTAFDLIFNKEGKT